MDTGLLGRGGGARPRSLPEPLPRVWGRGPAPPGPPSRAEGDHRPLPGQSGTRLRPPPSATAAAAQLPGWGGVPPAAGAHIPARARGALDPGPGEAGSPVVRTRTGPALTSTGAPSAAPSPSPGPAASGPPLSSPRLPNSPTRVQRRGLAHPRSEFRERRQVPRRGPRPPRYPSQRRPSRACPGVDAGGPALRGLQRDPGRPP